MLFTKSQIPTVLQNIKKHIDTKHESSEEVIITTKSGTYKGQIFERQTGSSDQRQIAKMCVNGKTKRFAYPLANKKKSEELIIEIKIPDLALTA